MTDTRRRSPLSAASRRHRNCRQAQHCGTFWPFVEFKDRSGSCARGTSGLFLVMSAFASWDRLRPIRLTQSSRDQLFGFPGVERRSPAPVHSERTRKRETKDRQGSRGTAEPQQTPVADFFDRQVGKADMCTTRRIWRNWALSSRSLRGSTDGPIERPVWAQTGLSCDCILLP